MSSVQIKSRSSSMKNNSSKSKKVNKESSNDDLMRMFVDDEDEVLDDEKTKKKNSSKNKNKDKKNKKGENKKEKMKDDSLDFDDSGGMKIESRTLSGIEDELYGEPLSHEEMRKIEKALKAITQPLEWEWVKGHSGEKWNSYCDRIAGGIVDKAYARMQQEKEATENPAFSSA